MVKFANFSDLKAPLTETVTAMVMPLRYKSNALFPGGKCVINAEMHIVNAMRINFYEHAIQDLHSRFMVRIPLL